MSLLMDTNLEREVIIDRYIWEAHYCYDAIIIQSR